MMMHVLLIAVVIGSLLEIRGFLYKNIRTASYSSRTSSKTSMQLDSFHADFSIIDRSMSCLDFQIILDNLQNLTVTSAARERCRSSFSNDVAEVQKEYALVSEMLNRIHDIPLRSKMNVWPIIKAIEDNSSPPDKEDLSLFARDMEEIIELQSYLESQIVDDRMLLYLDLAEEMSLPEELKNEFTNSFDDEENLNPEKYPAIKVLVKQINSLKSKIVQTIQSLLSSQEMKEKIADR